MKISKCVFTIGIFILLLCVLCGCETVEQNEPVIAYSNENNRQQYTLENDGLLFQMDGATSYFTLTHKHSGEVWHGVPEDGGEDPAADATMKNWLRSTMILSYTVPSGLNTIFDNYSNSIQNGTFQITQEGDSIRVDYLVGEKTEIFLLPQMVTQERFESLLAPLGKSQQASVKSIYRKLDPQDLPEDEDPEELMEKYPLLEQGVIYVQREGVAQHRSEQAQSLLAEQGYTMDDYLADKLPDEEQEQRIQFNVSVIYRLEENGLSVSVPGDSLRCSQAYQLTSLQVLPYFGAGSTDDTGYLLIPDGGGAVVDFNARKGTAGSISTKIYGWDLAKNRDKQISENAAQFPVFAIQKNKGYLLAIAESGAGELTLETNSSGNRNSYNSITPVFEVVHGDLTTISSKSGVQIMIYEKNRQYTDLTLRYIAGEGASYVDMAHSYRAYLQEKYPQLQGTQQDSLPVTVELIGAVDHISQVAGIPMQTVLPATTYQEAGQVLSRLQDMEIQGLSLKYTAILNGGLKQTALTKAELLSQLGSGEELRALAAQAEESGGLYLGGYTSLVLDTGAFDGFDKNTQAVRNTLSDIVQAYPYSTVTWEKEKDSPYYILNAEASAEASRQMLTTAQSFGFAGVAPEDIGSKVTSDFNQQTPMGRDAMAQSQGQLLWQAKEAGMEVMINTGNAYAAVYADHILNMDLTGSGYDLVSRQVPFYQIALHGLVTFAGEPVNMAQNYRENLLKSVETGAGLYFVFAQIPASELQMTQYTAYSSAQFEQWEETLAQLYEKLNAQLGHTYGLAITDHRYLTEQVTLTVYEDGTCVYVNYGSQDYALKGGSVKSGDFLVTGGESHG